MSDTQKIKENKKNKQQNTKLNHKKTEEKKSKVLGKVVIIMASIVVLALAAFGLWKLSGEESKPENVLVFSVGEEEVYLDEVNFCILQNLSSLGITAEEMETSTAQDGTAAVEHYKEEILRLIMDYKVSYQKAQQQGVSLTEEEREKVSTDVVKYLSQVDARVLSRWGVSEELVKEIFMQRYLVNKYEQEITEEIEVQDQRYCTIYMMLFPKVEMKEDGNYVVGDDGVTPVLLTETEIQQRKKDADAALQELKEGASVEEVAKKYGVDLFSAEESNTAESFGEPFSQYAESLKQGEYSPVLETESCYAIVKMVKENNEEIAAQIMEYYIADMKKSFLEEKRLEWYEELGVGDTPVFQGKKWEKISLYDYLQ